MNTFPVRLLLGLCLAGSPAVLRAAEPAPKAETSPAAPPAPTSPPAADPRAATPAAQAAPNKDPEVLELPKIQVTAKRVKELDKEIKRLDKAIAREKNNLKATELDKVLNNSKLTEAAAVFGGNSAEYMQEVAATRIRYMEAERDLLSDMKEPQTLEYLAIIKDELEKVRTMRRDVEKAAH